MEYSYFIENFKDAVENLVDSPKQRLIRLLKYTEGDAKELIKHCIHEGAETCYDTAIGLLQKEYGSPCAYLETDDGAMNLAEKVVAEDEEIGLLKEHATNLCKVQV